MNLMKKRWLVLIASCFVTLCIGSLYAWSVFATPMAEYLSELTGQEISSLAIVFTVANSVGPITMISGGFVNDKLGPKWVLLVGGFLFGMGMIGSGFAKSVTALILFYGLGVGLGVGLVYGTTVSNTVKFFPDKSGLAGGLITACYGGSSIVVPPIATVLVESYHVTTAFRMIGLVMMAVICASAFVITPCPPDFRPTSVKNKKEVSKPAQGECTYKELLTKPAFYQMLLILTCGAFAGLMVISQASPIAQQMMGFSVGQAAAVVSILALFNTFGRLVAGSISDKIGSVGTLKLTFAGTFLASLLLAFCTQERIALFYIGLVIIGFCFGGIMGIYPGFTAGQFGRKNNSVNYGIMFIGFALAGLVGPMLMNVIQSVTGKYQPAFAVSAVLAVIGELLIRLYGRKSKRRRRC